ncbi:MAG: hypothetical protein ACT4QG_04015 [Sporichthyaceae bacterium]
MSRKDPTPVRFDPEVAARLSAWTATQPGLSLSSAANRLVDEALRSEEHPSITFRAGPTGRRAGLVAGPDVWEVVRSVRSARRAEPDLDQAAIVDLIAQNTGLVRAQVEVAIGYWAAYPTEIDAEIATAEAAEDAAESAWLRRQELLARP